MQKVENFLNRHGFKSYQTRNDKKLFESQTQSSNLFAQGGEVIFESMSYFFDQAMEAKSLKDSRYLSRAFIGKVGSHGLVTKSADIELTASYNGKQGLIIFSKEIETFVTAFSGFNSLGNGVQFYNTITGIGKSRDKDQIAEIGGFEQTDQRKEAINAGFQISHLFDLFPCFLIDLPKGLKLGNIIDRGFDTQYETEFVIHLDGICTHMVTYASPFKAGIKVVADFALVIHMKFCAQKGSDVFRFNRNNGAANEGLIKKLKIGLFSEDNVSGIFNLDERPIVGEGEGFNERTTPLGQNIQDLVQVGYTNLIGEFLGSGKIGQIQESIVMHGMGNRTFGEISGQPVMPVKVELQMKGTPGGDAQIAQTKEFIDKVKIVIKTFAYAASKRSIAGLGISPGLISGTLFHHRKDSDQAGMTTSFFDNGLNLVFFTNFPDFTNKLYLNAIFSRQIFSILAYFFIKGFAPDGIIKKQDLTIIEERGHSLWVTPIDKSTPNNDSIKTRQNTLDLVFILFGNQCVASIHYRIRPLFYNEMDGNSTYLLVLASPG
jgi:hypothetical protein